MSSTRRRRVRFLGGGWLRRLVPASAIALSVAIAAPSAAYAGTLVSDQADPGFPTADGRVKAMVPWNGTVFIAGSFRTVGGQPRGNIAQITNAGQVTLFRNDVNGPIDSMALSPDGSTLYFGGKFTAVGPTPRRNLAAISTGTGQVTGFAPNPSSRVKGIAVSSSRIYVTGSSTRSYDLAGHEDPNFHVDLSPPDFFPERVGGIGIFYFNGQLFLGGYFSAINGSAHKNLAAIDPATGNVTSWRGRSTCPPMSWTTSPDGKTLFMGCAGGGGHGNRPVAIDLATGNTLWEGNGDGNVQAVAWIDGILYVGGHFTYQLDVHQPRLMAFDAATGAILPWYPRGRVNSALGVWSLLAVNGSLWMGGDFTRPTNHLARFNP